MTQHFLPVNKLHCLLHRIGVKYHLVSLVSNIFIGMLEEITIVFQKGRYCPLFQITLLRRPEFVIDNIYRITAFGTDRLHTSSTVQVNAESLPAIKTYFFVSHGSPKVAILLTSHNEITYVSYVPMWFTDPSGSVK